MRETTLTVRDDLTHALASARDAAMENPDLPSCWERLEQIGRSAQRVEEVGAVYREVLGRHLEPNVALAVATRAVRLYDEWLDDKDEVHRLLEKIVQIDPTTRWAFDRLSLHLTMSGRWTELLSLYDRAIAATDDDAKRVPLLEEVAHIAKDCAGQVDRAISYLDQIFSIKPYDAQAAGALERLLKQQGKHRELIAFWTARLPVLEERDAFATRYSIASCWLDSIGDPASALRATEPLLVDPDSASAACGLLERILASPASTRSVREQALTLLSGQYDATGRWMDVVRALEPALHLAEREERIHIHEEIARRLVEHEREDDALEHLAVLVAIDGGTWTEAALKKALKGSVPKHRAQLFSKLDRSRGRSLLHRAARTAADRFGDRDRAVLIYRQLLDDSADDLEAISRLAALYEKGDRVEDLLELRRHELSLAETVPRRVPLRLQIASLLRVLGDGKAAAACLRENLAEQPDHEPSIDALTDILEAQEDYQTLGELLTSQAQKVAALDQGKLAASLWLRAAVVYEAKRHDIHQALPCYRRVVELEANAEALDALARIHVGLGQHAQAVEWLEKRLAVAAIGERTTTFARLARAYIGADQRGRALACLQQGLSEDPTCLEVRQLLADLHRSDGAWEPLVKTLVEGVSFERQDSVRFAFLREAAEVTHHQLGHPERAIPILEQALTIAPMDAAVRSSLADALRAAGRLDEARAIATTLIEDYGRRHPPERAGLHLLLAQIAYAQGDANEAIRQLETASTMDMANDRVQAMLGRVYRAVGQLDRAERAFHALLLILRRARAAGSRRRDGMSISETLFEIHRVAAALGATERASEALESAFDAALEHEFEAERLERSLREAGYADSLLRLLRQKLSALDDPERQSGIHAEMAGVLEHPVGRLDQAFEEQMKAVLLRPAAQEHHDRAYALAQKAGMTDRYTSALSSLVERVMDEAALDVGCDLLLRLGAIEEQNPARLDVAAQIYARAETTGEREVDVLRAVARVAHARQDREGETRALVRLADIHLPAMGSADAADVLYRLADLRFGAPESMHEGLETLARAYELEPQHERAALSLSRALDVAPQSRDVVSQYEHVARLSGDADLLLDALDRSSMLPGSSQETIREAAQLAAQLGRDTRQQKLLARAVERAREEGTDLGTAMWALERLADRAKASGDVAAAILWLQEAARAATPARARDMWMEVAALAERVGDYKLAADTFERVLAAEPSDTAVLDPTLRVVRRLGDPLRLERLLEAAVEAGFDPGERCAFRLELAYLLRAQPERSSDAIRVLGALLIDDPEHREAAELLASMLQQAGRIPELCELITQQLDLSRERKEPDLAVRLAMQFGPAIAAVQRRDAAAAYRSVLEWVPAHRQLLHALVELLDPDLDAQERADAMEQLLRDASDDDAVALALRLVDAREKLHDRDGVERALEHAFRMSPDSHAVRDKLAELAARFETEAPQLSTVDAAVAALRHAASIHAYRLENPEKAAAVLRAAMELAPGELSIISDLAQALRSSGHTGQAIELVTHALESRHEKDRDVLPLLRLRARLASAGGFHLVAVRDLDVILSSGDTSVAPALLEELVRARDAAGERGERDVQRTMTRRLVQLLREMGELDRARSVVSRWVEDAPSDIEALHLLHDMDWTRQRWPDVARTCEQLVRLEDGARRAVAALQLAEAYERMDRPEEALPTLQFVFNQDPSQTEIRARLRKLYEQTGANKELATLLLVEADQTSDETLRFEYLREAGRLRLRGFENVMPAIGPLCEAHSIRPSDFETILLLADAYIASGLIQEAVQLLQTAIDRHGGRRSRELAALQHRMARAAATSDRANELSWLAAAFESYPQGMDVACEVADLAAELGQYELAIKALRAIASTKTSARISRPMAFLRQAQIARLQGDDRRAVFLARKAQTEDPNFTEADDFLQGLEAD